MHNPHALIPPIFGTDEFGTTTEWNPAMQKLTGYPRDEVVGKMLVGEVFGLSMMLCRLQVGRPKTSEICCVVSVRVRNMNIG